MDIVEQVAYQLDPDNWRPPPPPGGRTVVCIAGKVRFRPVGIITGFDYFDRFDYYIQVDDRTQLVSFDKNGFTVHWKESVTNKILDYNISAG